MRVLFIVHIEEMFRSHFPSLDYVDIVANACRCDGYDRVILLNSGIELDEPVLEMQGVADEEWEWGWGYEPEAFEDDPAEGQWCIPAGLSAHEYTWVPHEIRDAARWRRAEIDIAGGYDGECLTDWEAVLNHLEIPFNRREDLIYGSQIVQPEVLLRSRRNRRSPLYWFSRNRTFQGELKVTLSPRLASGRDTEPKGKAHGQGAAVYGR